MNTISTAKTERQEAISRAMKRGFIKTHEGLGIMRNKRPAAHPVTLAEVADGCLDAPEFLPAGGFVASACIIGRITTDCVDR